MVVQAIGIVTDLRSQNKNLSYLYMASGLLSAGDSGGGLFWWNPVSTAADDGVNVIQVTGVTPGRWVRIFDGSAGVPSSRQLTINGVTYNLSADRTWSINLNSVTGQGAVTTNSITVGSVYLTNMTAGSGALYYSSGLNRVTLANYNAGGSVYVEVNGGSYSAVFGSDLSFTSYGTIAGVFNNATVDTDRFIVSDAGVLKYRTGAEVLSDIGAQPAGNYVPTSRTLTINGTTYDLSANRTWNVGTVTGTGTNNYLALWNSSTGITTSGILQNGTSGYYLDSNSDFGTSFNFRNNATNSMIYTVELVNYSSPKATKHSYTSGIVISEIASSFVSRIFANGNHIIGSGITDNGYKLEVQGIGRFTGALTLDTISNATIDTDRFLVSDSGVVKYRTGTQLLSDIGGQPAGSYVTTSRTLTINGTAYDLSADRTWSVGTVTSVQLSAGTGISLAGTNPITTSGTITVTNTAPDQIVTIAAGENISVSGTYPNFTISATGEIISSFLLMGA